MPRIGIIVGSLHSNSINREVAKSLLNLMPEGVEAEIIDISQLPLYTPDYDADYPAAGREFKAAIDAVDGLIILTPEYMRTVSAALKNALEWAARPWGQGSLQKKPVAITGASIGAIGTAAAQQTLRQILGHMDAIVMGQPETFLRFDPAAFPGNGEVADESVKAILEGFVNAAVAHVERHAAVKA